MYKAQEIKLRHDLRTIIPAGPKSRDCGDYRVQLCLWHDEDRPSLLVYPTKYICKSCGVKGDVFDWTMVHQDVSFSEAARILSEGQAKTYVQDAKYTTPINQSLYREYQFGLNERAIDYYTQRGLTTETIAKYSLGYGKPPGRQENRFAIPIFHNEELKTIKFRRDDGCECGSFSVQQRKSEIGTQIFTCYVCGLQWETDEVEQPKYVGIRKHSSPRLYQNPGGEVCLIVEGEFDCLIALQLGFSATSSTGGATSFHHEWGSAFGPSRYVLSLLDNDRAGSEGRIQVKRVLPKVIDVFLPVEERGDLTDFVVSGGNLHSIVDNAIFKENFKRQYEARKK